LQKLDLNHDGVITVDEFINYCSMVSRCVCCFAKLYYLYLVIYKQLMQTQVRQVISKCWPPIGHQPGKIIKGRFTSISVSYKRTSSQEISMNIEISVLMLLGKLISCDKWH
jgi:hypothetical protein